MSKSPQKEKHPSHHEENEWIKKVSTYKTSQMSSEELGQIMRQHSMVQRKIHHSGNSKNLTKSKKRNKLDSLDEIFDISGIENQLNNEKEDDFCFSSRDIIGNNENINLNNNNQENI